MWPRVTSVRHSLLQPARIGDVTSIDMASRFAAILPNCVEMGQPPLFPPASVVDLRGSLGLSRRRGSRSQSATECIGRGAARGYANLSEEMKR